MAEFQNRALLVRRIPYGDTSLVCHFFTEHHGRIAVMARGARRPKSVFRASLEPLYDLHIGWRPGRSGMGTLTDVQRGAALLQPAQVIDGQELLAIASRLFQEGDPHGFAELHAAFELFASRQQQGLLAATWQLLTDAGWLGDLSHCWLCGNQAEGSMFWQHAQLVCGDCGRGMELSAGLRKSMHAVMHAERIQLSERYDSMWRQMIALVLREHGIKATDSFRQQGSK